MTKKAHYMKITKRSLAEHEQPERESRSAAGLHPFGFYFLLFPHWLAAHFIW
jgi:hypothetical protein